MNSPLTLRPIRTDDEAFLLRVYAGTRAAELALVDWDDSQKAAFVRMQFDAQHHFYREQFPDAAFDVVLRDGAPIGRLYVDRRADEFRILDIALLPEHRGAGVGGALLRRLLAEADQAGLPVRIHVERSNPALRLYERLGFIHTEETAVYFLMERRPGSGAG